MDLRTAIIRNKYCFPCECPLPIKQKKQSMIEQIVETGAAFYGFTTDDVIDKGRMPEVIACRFAVMNFLIKTGKYSLKAIGHFFGRNHATVINARDGYTDFLAKNQVAAAESKAFFVYMDKYYQGIKLSN